MIDLDSERKEKYGFNISNKREMNLHILACSDKKRLYYNPLGK